MVIPKEIRRTLRIREGDPLEIYTDKDGEVIFKKYSLLGDLQEVAGHICETVAKALNCPVLVTDRDTVIAAAGAGKRELLDHRVSSHLENVMNGRRTYQLRQGERPSPVTDDALSSQSTALAAPILSEGDVMGCVVFACREAGQPLGETEHRLAQIVAAFLGKHMEN
ncbi:MAG: AbrB/MazE/SpoVT family DNA-binding domain-containing protein [Oscillospiraceae bacterium]|nr:AbrB/MazE/SpoVT family DNA-binding domain-containing protein [Oscillospiraceae bacterium]